jgi:hypothetical protein
MRTGTSRGRRAPLRRIPALVVATITALASISEAVPLRFLRAPRGAVVLVRALIVSAHVPAVPVPIPPLSAIIMAVVRISSSTSPYVIAIDIAVPSSSVVVVISPSLRVPLRDSSPLVSGARARFRVCVATTAVAVYPIGVAVLFE